MTDKMKAELSVTLAEYATAILPASWGVAPKVDGETITFGPLRIGWASRVEDPERDGLPLACYEIREYVPHCPGDEAILAEADSVEDVARLVVKLVWERRLNRFAFKRTSFEEIPF